MCIFRNGVGDGAKGGRKSRVSRLRPANDRAE